MMRFAPPQRHASSTLSEASTSTCNNNNNDKNVNNNNFDTQSVESAPTVLINQQQNRERTLSGDTAEDVVVVIDKEESIEHCLYGEVPIKLQMSKAEVLQELLLSKSSNDDDCSKENNTNDNISLDGSIDDNKSIESQETVPEVLEELAPVSSKWSDCIHDDPNTSYPNHSINIKTLRKIASAGGIVDDDECISHRAVTWRVLLNYLPTDTKDWHITLKEKRNWYVQCCIESFININDIANDELRNVRNRNNNNNNQNNQQPPPPNTPPPNYISNSSHHHTKYKIPQHIKQYFKIKGHDIHVLERLTKDMNSLRMDQLLKFNNNNNNENSNNTNNNNEQDNEQTIYYNQQMDEFINNVILLDEIRKDVVRTHTDLSFFLEPYNNLGRRRYAAIERILFIWSKHNKSIKYVQGMNEIVGILYYVLANDSNYEWSIWAEVDTYWLLHTLLIEMNDVFVPSLDDHTTGIQGRIQSMYTLLAKHDPEVKEHLDELGIEVSFYAIRWWTTLLSREFLLPDVIRIWDSMFASTHKDNFLKYVCVTMISLIREQILKSDFTTCLKLLHTYPSINNIELLISSSRSLYIYETQITLACHRGGLNLHYALTTIQSPTNLIIAYGFHNGTPPVTRTEQLERAKSNVETTMRNAAQGMFGRAKGLYNNWYNNSNHSSSSRDNYTKKERAALALGRAKDAAAASSTDGDGKKKRCHSEEDVYLQAIMNSSLNKQQQQI